MPRFVALLRGINVGRAKPLAMADLRALLADLGHTEVRTHLRSGNAVLTAEPGEHGDRIRDAIAERLGLDVACIVVTGEHLRAVIAGNPLGALATEGSKMMVMFQSAAPDPHRLAEHDPIALDPDNARLGDRVIYQWCPNGLLEAPALATFVERRWGVTVTARNWNTVTKLAGLL